MTVETLNLEEVEKSCVALNSKLLQAMDMLRAGRSDSALSVLGVAQSMNAANRLRLLKAGVLDSVRGAGPHHEIKDDLDEDEEFPDVDSLDLSKLKI